jgi:hypothetical protein
VPHNLTGQVELVPRQGETVEILKTVLISFLTIISEQQPKCQLLKSQDDSQSAGTSWRVELPDAAKNVCFG